MSKITKSAKNEQCQVRIDPELCTGEETTVFAHISSGEIARKASDIHGAYACSRCHDIIDGRLHTFHGKMLVDYWFMEGVLRTQLLLIEKGLVRV